MRCPWCEPAAGTRGAAAGPAPGLTPRALHAHLGECHSDQVRTGERNGRVCYQITCPACGSRYEHLVRKAARDPDFVEGFGREIAMVALDMLVHHLMAEHEQPEAAGPAAGSAERRQPRPQRTGE